MGAYLSQPITKKDSTDHESSNISCGASSMQGWRIYQEDAHNVIIDFDEKISLFAVYDGHGGAEVAKYTADHLPKFIKDTEEFKKGNYKQALINAFMQFDESLIKEEVLSILKNLKKQTEGEENYPDTDEDVVDEDDEDNVNNLYEEATMPLSEVIAKYKHPSLAKLKDSGDKPMSPMLKSKDKKSSETSCSSSSASGSGLCKAGGSGLCKTPTKSQNVTSSSSSPSSSKLTTDSNGESSSNLKSEEKSTESETAAASTTSTAETSTTETSDVTNKTNEEIKEEKNHSKNEEQKKDEVKEEATAKQNGDVEEIKKTENTNGDEKKADEVVTTASTPECVKGNPKVYISNGDGEPDSNSTEDSTNTLTNGNKKRSPRKMKKLGTESLLESTLDDEDSESDEDFKMEEASSDDSDDEQSLSRVPDDGTSDEDDEDEEDDDDDDEDDEDDSDEEMTPEIQKRMKEAFEHKEVPGMDSGCTAVVVLKVDNKIYVANAGDSRAVISRNGKAKDLSEDHKPEDELERKRIEKAGGEVTADGRVNGGLNLSRALGDHSYKQTKTLSLAEQMISGLPDITELTLEDTDDFIVLACDGIWNSMSSQEVIDFVKQKIEEKKKLSVICEQLFDKCLAPDSMGDGTGCDNMTCIIVNLKPNATASDAVAGTKRIRDDDTDNKVEDGSNPAKKTKSSDEETTSEKDTSAAAASS